MPLKSGSEATGIIGVTRPPGSPPFQQELAERRRTEAELQKAYQTLERRVPERTRELEILNAIAASRKGHAAAALISSRTG